MEGLRNASYQQFHFVMRRPEALPVLNSNELATPPGYRRIYSTRLNNSLVAHRSNVRLDVKICEPCNDGPVTPDHFQSLNCMSSLFGLRPTNDKPKIHTRHTINNPFSRNTYYIQLDVQTANSSLICYVVELFYMERSAVEKREDKVPPRQKSSPQMIRLKDLIEVFAGIKGGCQHIVIPEHWVAINLIYKGHASYPVKSIEALVDLVRRHDSCIDVGPVELGVLPLNRSA